MTRGQTHAVVALAVLDMRRRPDHRSELTSQLLMGETVRLLARSRDGHWWRAENAADGYKGYVRGWGLLPASRARVERWLELARARVVTPSVRAVTSPGGDAQVVPLHWNARVIPRRSRAGWREVEMPSGARGWVPGSGVRVGGGSVALEDRVRGLLGTPYLWGGRTALGLDCSALTQQLLFEQGISLPRDAAHQFRATRAIPPGEAPRAGDLIFFADRSGRVGHVGLHLGGGYFVQARGCVKLSAVHRHNPLYDKELGGTLLGSRRA